LTPGGILLLQQVVEILVLSLLVFVNFSIIGNNLNKADVLVVDANSLRTRVLQLQLEHQFLLWLVSLIFTFTIFLVFLFSVNGSLIFHGFIVDEENLDEFFSLLMFELNGVVERHVVCEFLSLVVDLLGHTLGLAVALDVSSSSIFTSELNVSKFIHFADSNLALIKADSSG